MLSEQQYIHGQFVFSWDTEPTPTAQLAIFLGDIWAYKQNIDTY